MLDRLEQIEKHYQELDRQIALPEVNIDPEKLQALAQEKADLEDLVTKYRAYRETAKELEDTKAMLDGAQEEDMSAMVKQEIEKLEARLENRPHPQRPQRPEGHHHGNQGGDGRR